MKYISILGSTGSIGTQTLDVISHLKDMKVLGLTTNLNIDRLEEQIYKFKPQKVAIMDYAKAKELKDRLINIEVEVLSGLEGIIEVACIEQVDVVVTSIVGMIGIKPTIAAIKEGKEIALANKETLVTAGKIVMELAKKYDVNIYPVDSEHSAIFQCLQGNKKEYLSKIILTASGGPFRGKNYEQLRHVVLKDALKHPNWSMGKKITIDSATLMNKGLEVIEAKWLFELKTEQIEVVVHPQSMIHSMVEYKDGSIIAQIGQPDMRIPIQYALTYPKRVENIFPKIDFTKIADFTFEQPDLKTFKCLKLAFDVIKQGETMPTVLNAANEEAVSLFLQKKIKFLDIPEIIEDALLKHKLIKNPNINDILETETWTRNYIESRWL